MKLTILFVQIFQYYFFFFKKTKTTNRHLKSQKNGPYIRTTYILMLVFIICALRVGVEIANAWRLTVDTVHNIGGRIIYAGRKRRWEGEERRGEGILGQRLRNAVSRKASTLPPFQQKLLFTLTAILLRPFPLTSLSHNLLLLRYVLPLPSPLFNVISVSSPHIHTHIFDLLCAWPTLIFCFTSFSKLCLLLLHHTLNNQQQSLSFYIFFFQCCLCILKRYFLFSL